MPVLPSWRELVVATVPGSPRAHPAGQRWSTCPAATNASKWSRTRSVNRPASNMPRGRPAATEESAQEKYRARFSGM